MIYKLALAVGVWDVEGWLTDGQQPDLPISSRQISWWQAYYEIEPWGEERADLRNGTLITAIDRMLLGDKSEARPDQFVLKFAGPKKQKREKNREQSAEEQLATFRTIMNIHAGSEEGRNSGNHR